MNEKTDMVTERLMDRQLHGRGLFKRGEGWEERRKLVPPWTPFQCLVWELPQTYWRLLIPSMPYYMYFISFCVLIGKAPTTSKGRQACIWRLQMDTKSQWHFHIATRRRREMSKRYCENYRLKLVSVWVRSQVGWGVGGGANQHILLKSLSKDRTSPWRIQVTCAKEKFHGIWQLTNPNHC